MQALEGHDFRALLNSEGVEREGHVHGAGGGLRGEGGLGGHGVAVRVEQGLLGDGAVLGDLLHMERSGDGVLLAGDEVHIGNRVHHGGGVVGHDVVVAVNAVLGGGADFRCDDTKLLVYVTLVLVLGGERAVREEQLLVDRDGPAAQLVGRNLHLHDRLAGGPGGREGRGDAHGLTVGLDGFTRLGIDHGGDELVLLTLGEAGVGHLVGDGHATRRDALVAVHGVVGVGGDFRLHVVQRAEIVGHAVTGDGDGGLDEGVTLVGGATQLLDGVAVIGQRAKRVVRRRHGALGGKAEPSASRHIELGAVDDAIGVQRPVVAVGVVGVGVPRGGGAKVAVLVGHDNVALSGGLARHLEGDAHKTLGGGVRLLGELKVRALHLIVDVPVPGDRVHEDAVLGDGELMGGAVGEVVALDAADLLQGVVTGGEAQLVRGRVAVLDGKGLHNVTLAVGHSVHEDRVVVLGPDLERSPVEGRGPAERGVKVALKVTLVDLDTAAQHVVGGGELIDLAVFGDGDVDVVRSVQVGVVGRALADDVVAVGQRVVRSGGVAALVGGDGLHDLTRLVLHTVNDDRVLVVVDDGKVDALEAAAALRGLAGLCVELLDGDAAALHALGNLRSVIGNNTHNRLFLNLLEAQCVLVQVVALRGLGLIDHDSATRESRATITAIIQRITRYDIAF